MAPFNTSEDIQVTSDLLAQLAESDIESEGESEFEDDLDEEGSVSKRKLDTSDGMIEPASKHQRGDEEASSKKYLIPTAEELTSLREAEMLYHSNIFRLQVDELFANTTIKTKHVVRIEEWISKFSAFVQSLENSNKIWLDNEKMMEEHNLVIPLHAYKHIPKHGGTFQFMPPNSIETVGSFSIGIIDKNDVNIDLALTLPKEFFHKKDLYNGRWIVLRAMYLSWLSKQIKGSDLVSDMEWTLHSHCDTRPLLKITPSLHGNCTFYIFIYPIPPAGLFNREKTDSSRSLVLPSYMFGKEQSEEKNSPTPYYNWTCAVDLVMSEHNRFIKSKLGERYLIDGLKLLRFWWMQRNFNKGCGGMSFHVVMMFALYLVKIRKLNVQMSSYQVFRAVLLALAESNWTTDGPTLLDEEESESVTTKGNKMKDSSKISQMSKFYPVSFVDHLGAINLTGVTALHTYKEIRFECQKAISSLESPTSDGFEALFLTKMDFYLAFDQFIKIRFTESEYEKCLQKCAADNPDSVTLDYLGTSPSYIWKSIFDVLERGLGDRVDLISCRRAPAKIWKLDEEPPAPVFKATFGLIFNENAFGLLTKGPSAESPDTKSFRAFWGEKSTLRRFKDGSFHEAVLWGEPDISVNERRNIPFELSKYLMKFHFGLKHVTEISTEVEDLIKIGNQCSPKFGTGEELLQACTYSFDSICKILKKAELPLKISSIVSISDVTRHSCVFPPIKLKVLQSFKDNGKDKILCGKPVTLSYFKQAIEGLIFLEISGKWPDDLLAIQAIKVEFLRCLAAILRKQQIECIVFPDHIKVNWDGYLFNFKLCHRREIYIRRLVPFKNSKLKLGEEEIQERDTIDSLKLEVDIEILPRLTMALYSIKNEHVCYSASVRLILRWVSSHMLLRHINQMSVELLCAHIFQRPEPYSPPCSPHIALFRFMKLVSGVDWKTTPFLVNVGGQFKDSEECEILKMFEDQRELFPKMFVCSPCELRGSEDNVYYDSQRRFSLLSSWTKTHPSIPILSRLRALARSALSFYEAEMKKKTRNLKPLFLSPLDDYDVVIHLRQDSKYLKNLERTVEKMFHRERQARKVHSSISSTKQNIPFIQFDPIEQYYSDLEDSFGEHCLFFHDIYGGAVIGVVFKPESKVMKELKVSDLEGVFITHGKKSRMSANIEAIVKDFEFMGRGIIKSIEVKNK